MGIHFKTYFYDINDNANGIILSNKILDGNIIMRYTEVYFNGTLFIQTDGDVNNLIVGIANQINSLNKLVITTSFANPVPANFSGIEISLSGGVRNHSKIEKPDRGERVGGFNTEFIFLKI